MRWIFGVILVWLVFVMSLASWWLYFGVNTLSVAASSGVSGLLARHQRMLFLEGCVLLASLLIGGIGLFYFSFRMYKEKSAKEMFFASFAHDLKTALFRLQLEVENLQKSVEGREVDNILNHTRKMQLDLENSLDLTIGASQKLFIEKVNLKNFLVDLHAQWPEFHIKYNGADTLMVDKKALHSIFKNLLHNSSIHGQADTVQVELKNQKDRVQVFYSDNGQPYGGDLAELGRSSRYSQRGSGFGLFIVRQWVTKLKGDLQFSTNATGALQVVIDLPGERP